MLLKRRATTSKAAVGAMAEATSSEKMKLSIKGNE